MAIIYLKLKKKFLNMGTQKECVELFAVNEKQLSKLIMGRHYQGGKDQLTHKWKAPDDGQGMKKVKKDILAGQGRAPNQ